MPLSRIILIVFLVALGGVLLWMRGYVDERGTQGRLAAVECAGLLPTVLEVQGKRIPVSREQTCRVLDTIAHMTPIAEGFARPEEDPWHYYGRMRILPKDDAWFLIFIARAGDNYHPLFSLQHRRANGWSVIGQFDALPVLRILGIEGGIDSVKLRSTGALAPVDQNLPM